MEAAGVPPWPKSGRENPNIENPEVLAQVTGLTGRVSSPPVDEIEPLDWLLNFVQAHDHTVSADYWHMVDGRHRTCGCPREGDDDAR
jgi:hypothetical protein